MLKHTKKLSTECINLTIRRVSMLAAIGLLAACAAPQAPVSKSVYDLGLPAALATAELPKDSPVLVLADVISPTALDSTALVYRLAYADVHQLRAYSLARWSMPPAQLVQLRVRNALGARGPVLGVADGVAPWRLQVELDEFSQVFESPGRSAGVVRLRATLLHKEQWVGQQIFSASSNATAQDAAGGVRALTAAADDAVAQMDGWVAQQMQLPK